MAFAKELVKGAKYRIEHKTKGTYVGRVVREGEVAVTIECSKAPEDQTLVDGRCYLQKKLCTFTRLKKKKKHE